ncbi:MAG: ornithine cyclodeaminase family protein [Gaiella sp.]
MLYLTEAEVEALASPADALPVVEAVYRRLADGQVEQTTRERLPVDRGEFAVMAAVDRGLGLAGHKSYTWIDGQLKSLVLLFSLDDGQPVAMIEADHLGWLRTGASSGVAAASLAREGATTLGVIGCGWHARGQVAAIRAALPHLERTVAWCRSAEHRAEFCEEMEAEPAGRPEQAAVCDVVVTVTTSRTPVLHGDWLSNGALVIGVAANDPSRRELDDAVIERASLVCCDSLAETRHEAGDLITPVEGGVLAWDDIHELHTVIAGAVARTSQRQIVVFKSNGMAALDIAMGGELVRRAAIAGTGLRLVTGLVSR